MSEKITSRRIVELLRMNRHPSDRGEWASFDEVRNGTGFGRETRYMDLFAINCWPSKKFRSCAYEVKVDRSDFMREILDPSKRAFAEKVAMECWFATPAGLVKPDEVPEGWGLVTVDSAGKLKTLKMPAQRKPEPWPMSFIAALLRKSADPASKVPEVLWKLAGSDLTEAQLLDAMEGTLKDARRTIRYEVEREVRQENRSELDLLHADLEKARRFRGDLALKLGLDRWAGQHRPDEELLALVGQGLPAKLLEGLEDLHRRVGHVLDTIKKPD